MGETIRYLMVAIVALIASLICVPTHVVAQGTSRGFEIPKSLSGGFSGATESTAVPPFTSGVSPRAGGPTTDPTSVRDSSWLIDASGRSRPSTEPYQSPGRSSTSAGQSSSDAMINQLRSGQLPGGSVATVGATQDPQSREAQLMAQARQPNAGAANQSAAASSGASRGFGSLPAGVSLPTQGAATGMATQNSPGTFGSEFARDAAAASSSAVVYGPKTAQEANYDLSVFNSKTNAAASSASPYQGSAQQEFSLPGNFGNSNVAAQQGGNGSGLGMPATDPRVTDPRLADPRLSNSRQTDTTLPSNWTYDQIAQLGRMFGIQPNDPRMTDKSFVNQLYASFREHQAKEQTAQTATGILAGGDNATSRAWPGTAIGSNGTGLTGQSQMTLPPGQLPGQPSQTTATSGSLANDPRYASRNGVGSLASGALASMSNLWAASQDTATRPDVDPRLSQKDIDGLPPGAYSYDKYNNPIDKLGYIVDRFGERVDAETQYELTIGKKHRLEEERLAALNAERARLTGSTGTSAGTASPSDRFAAATQSGGQVPPSLRNSGADPTVVNRPAMPGIEGSVNSGLRGPVADQAGIGGAAKALGNSNPYVNVFLLCSLVANAFLIISLHRLWYRLRDLIASSRMAVSGISND